jgi:hypothetical protein
VSAGGIVDVSVNVGSGVSVAVVSGGGVSRGVVVLSLDGLEGSSTSIEGSSDSGFQIVVVRFNDWGVVDGGVVHFDWESRSLGDFTVVLNNWGGDLFNVVVVMVIMMMMFMMVMVVTMMVMMLVVLVEESKVGASSDIVLVGEESVGEGDEVRSVGGVDDQHILDKVISEVGVSVGDELESFLDEVLADGAVLVVVGIFRVQKSGKSKESLTQRVNIGLGLVALDF